MDHAWPDGRRADSGLRWARVHFSSEKGPGSMHAPIFISLGAGLVVGFLAQHALCTMGAIRDLLIIRDFSFLLWGLVAMLVTAFVVNLAWQGQCRICCTAHCAQQSPMEFCGYGSRWTVFAGWWMSGAATTVAVKGQHGFQAFSFWA